MPMSRSLHILLFLIGSVMLLSCPRASEANGRCAQATSFASGNLADYKRYNFNAQKMLAVYQNPNDRDLRRYNSITGLNRRRARSLINLVPEGGTAIDLGGGRGSAFVEMATQKKINAIVVNTQPIPQSTSRPPMKGKFEYIQGWAEEILRDFENDADLITDIWGAFSYSPVKVQLLEMIYRALRPGAKAYILFHPRKTVAQVNWFEIIRGGPRVTKKTASLHIYLSRFFPNIFRVWPSSDFETSEVVILELTKPTQGPKVLDLGLYLSRVKLVRLRKNFFVHIYLRKF